MTELSESQCEKLDQILNMFGDKDHLDADKTLSIEPNERKASAFLDLLAKKGFITRVGEAIGRTLPLIINIEPAADLFIDNGGFMAEFRKQQYSMVSASTIVNIHNKGHNNVINTGNHSSISAGYNKTADVENLSDNSAIAESGPHLEADFVYHRSGRSNQGYSNNNPIEIGDDGQPVYVIGFANKPIIYWRLDWNYLLIIYNNSSYPAYNIKIDIISGQQLTRLTKPSKINNLQPGDKLLLEAEYEYRIESTHVEADEQLKPKIPKALNGLCLQITYLDEKRRQHTTLVTIEDQEVINTKK